MHAIQSTSITKPDRLHCIHFEGKRRSTALRTNSVHHSAAHPHQLPARPPVALLLPPCTYLLPILIVAISHVDRSKNQGGLRGTFHYSEAEAEPKKTPAQAESFDVITIMDDATMEAGEGGVGIRMYNDNQLVVSE